MLLFNLIILCFDKILFIFYSLLTSTTSTTATKSKILSFGPGTKLFKILFYLFFLLYFAGKFPNNNKKRKYINEIYDEGDKKRRANSFTTTGAFKMNFNNASSLSRSFPITSSKNNQNSFLILNDNKFDIDNIPMKC